MKWRIGNREWRIGNREWRIGNMKWRIGNREWKTGLSLLFSPSLGLSILPAPSLPPCSGLRCYSRLSPLFPYALPLLFFINSGIGA